MRDATLSPDGLQPPEVCPGGEGYGGVGAINALRRDPYAPNTTRVPVEGIMSFAGISR
jgi:hypothetical protein